jgi:hypothetical protein
MPPLDPVAVPSSPSTAATFSGAGEQIRALIGRLCKITQELTYVETQTKFSGHGDREHKSIAISEAHHIPHLQLDRFLESE